MQRIQQIVGQVHKIINILSKPWVHKNALAAAKTLAGNAMLVQVIIKEGNMQDKRWGLCPRVDYKVLLKVSREFLRINNKTQKVWKKEWKNNTVALVGG